MKETMIIKRLYGLLVFVLVLTVLLTACGRMGPDAPPDKTPPTIVATVPGNSDTNVAPNAAISVTFSEPVDQSTITFTLSGGGATTTCAISYSGTSAIFTPSGDLAYNTLYTARVKAGVKRSEE